MDVFPAFVPLRGARVVVAGTGEAAEAKARLFEGSPATLVRVTEPSNADRPEVYEGAVLAFIACEEPTASRAATAARAAGAWVNVIDRPLVSDFHTPSIVDRGSVVGAIGTAGAAPLLAARLRAEWEARWPAKLGSLALLLASLKGELRAALPTAAARRAALYRILDGPARDAALAGNDETALALARAAIGGATPPGRVVHLRTPDEPDLLTLRDVGVLARADRLVHAADVDPAILAHARRDAPRSLAASHAEIAAWEANSENVVVLSSPGETAREAP